MLTHELVHIKQQAKLTRFQRWLFEQKYWLSKKFRYKIELEAYQAELNYYRKYLSKKKAKKMRKKLAWSMATSYGNMVDFAKAYHDLK